MNSYSLYIFDLDDTLFPTYKNVIKYHYPKLADKLGVEYPGDDVVSRYWGKDLIKSLQGIFKVVPNNVIDILLELHSEYKIEPFPNVRKILSTLKKHEKYVGIFTASFPDIMNYYINNYFVPKEKWFNFLLNTNAQHISKPSPHIVYLMMEKYRQVFKREIRLSEVVVIGDSLADYYTSKNAQVDFAAVLTGPTGRDEFIQAGLDQDHIYDSVQEALTPPDKHGIVAIIKNRQGEFLMVKETRPDSPYLNHWSGPHGRCIPDDIIEEETVVRETHEETGMLVRPLKKL